MPVAGPINLPRGRIVCRVHAGDAHCLLVTLNKNSRIEGKSISLYSVGKNNCGQLGIGKKGNRSRWTEVMSGLVDQNICGFATIGDHSLAVTENGELCFFGQYADETSTKPSLLYSLVGDDVKFCEVEAAENYSVGLEARDNCDHVPWMLHESGESNPIGMPKDDKRVIVKVYAMRAGRKYSYLEVDVATPTDGETSDNDLDSTSGGP